MSEGHSGQMIGAAGHAAGHVRRSGRRLAGAPRGLPAARVH